MSRSLRRSVRSIRRTSRCCRAALIAATSLAALISPAVAQEDPPLLEAVDYYHEHATSDLPSMLEATQRFERLAVERPDDWLRAYWTSFAYTQLGLFAGDERRVSYVALARAYYDTAREDAPEGDPRTEADLYALEGLIYSFLSRSEPSRAEEHTKRYEAAWERAGELDPENPMVWMTRALDLLPDEETRNEGHALTERAIELYEPRLGTVRPNWGREFIDVWVGSYPRVP